MRQWARATGRTRACLVATLLLTLSAPAQSQIAASALVAVGTPLRLTLVNGAQQVGRFERQTAAELQLRVACDSGRERLVRAAWRELRQVDAQVRGPVSPMRVAAGGLIGGVGTYLVLRGVATVSPCRRDVTCPDIAFEDQASKLVLGGSILGALVGRVSSRPRWETVWLAGSNERPR